MKRIKLIIHGLFIILLFASACNKTKEPIEEPNVFYTCSMDPQVMEKHPGKCPICHMELSKTIITSDSKKFIKLSDEQIHLANIRVDTAKMEMMGEEKIITGTTVVNENLTSVFSAKVAGRIEQLNIKNVGETISKGEVIYELYSEELLSAQQDYLLAIEKNKIQNSNNINADAFLNAAKNKLLLWGFSEQQLKNIELTNTPELKIEVYSNASGVVTDINVRQGDYVTEGTPILKIANLSSLWVEAQLYSGEQQLLDENNDVDVTISSYPDEIITGTIDFVNPELVSSSKIILIRISINNPQQKIKPGMLTYITLHAHTKKTLSLPADAVLSDEQGATVWVQNDDGSFEIRMVSTGMENKNNIEILYGLKEGEKVVTSGAYLLNSEYIFKNGDDPMAGMDM